MMPKCIVILLKAVHIDHQHHDLKVALQELQFHIAAERGVVQQPSQRIPAVCAFPVPQLDLRLALLRVCQHLHGIGIGNIRDDDLRAFGAHNGIIIYSAAAKHINVRAVLPPQLMLLKNQRIFCKAGIGLTQILNAVLLGDQVRLEHGPLPDIFRRIPRHLFEIFIHRHDVHGIIQQIPAVRDPMDSMPFFRAFTVGMVLFLPVLISGDFRLSPAILHLRRIFLQAAEKLRYDIWVKLAASASFQFFHGLRNGHGPPVRAVIDHGVIGVHHGDHTGQKRNALPAQAIRISLAVPPLVMVQDILRDPLQLRIAVGDLIALFRVGTQDLPFFFRELSRLIQDLQRNADLADVMQRRCR